jgi:hypothetical protein
MSWGPTKKRFPRDKESTQKRNFQTIRSPQKIPDALIDARAIPQLKDFHITKIHGTVSLVEVKGLSLQEQTVDERANLIDSDIEKAAASLDARYAGQRF